MNSLSALHPHILHYWPDDHTLQTQTGLMWGQLLQYGAPYYQGLPLMYPLHWTLHDILSADWPSVTTGLAGRYPRDTVLGLSITDGHGITTKAGGRVMKNVTGYDVCRLMVGSHHSLATITEVILKLTTLPKAFYGYWFGCASATQALTLCNTLLTHRREALWACETVSSSTSKGPKKFQVFVLSTEPLPADGFHTATTELLPYEAALQTAAQLSGFGWEVNTAGLSPNPSPETLSGILAVSFGTVAFAAHRLEECLAESDFSNYQWQCRPAAGLLLFSASLPHKTSVTQWETAFNNLLEGFPELQTTPKQASLRITQWPPSLTNAVNALHLPSPNTPEAHYYQSLKHLYDPNNLLQSPHLPLHLLNVPVA
ncbi:MAG: hypothetical protein QE263_00435 [Vampirovibrionales bacterium]|nr:hypothetical protein [Vampirovibrionales bacterium]